MLHHFKKHESYFSDNELKYKLIYVSGAWYFIPREKFINNTLSSIKSAIMAKSGFTLRPYGGTCQDENSEEDAPSSSESTNQLNNEDSSNEVTDEFDFEKYITYPEDLIGISVSNLPVFRSYEMIPDMKNGHIRNNKIIERGYTLEKECYLPLACIYFYIDISKRTCIIRCLGVDDKTQKRGLGSTLLNIAMLVASLYGCQKIKLEATENAVSTYLKNGFKLANNLVWDNIKLLNQDEIEEILISNENGYYDAKFKIDNPDCEKLFQAALKKYLHTDIAIKNTIEARQAQEDQVKSCLWKVLDTINKLSRTFNPIIAQRCLNNLESLSKMVKIPEHIFKVFDACVDSCYCRKGYQLTFAEENKRLKIRK